MGDLLALVHFIVVLEDSLNDVPDEDPFGPSASQLVHFQLLLCLAELFFLVGRDQVLLHHEKHSSLLLLFVVNAAQLLRLRHFKLSLQTLLLVEVCLVQRAPCQIVLIGGDGEDSG